MARKRIIDTEGLFLDVELWEMLGEKGILFYIRLWGLAEDWGGIELHPKKLALQMGMLECSEKEIKQFLEKLIQSGHIIPYENNQKQYGWIKNILKYQPLNNPAPPTLPLPPWIKCEIKRYKSGKKYAVYTINKNVIPQYITSSLPVDYQETTSNLPVALETETKQKRNGNVTETETNKVVSYETTCPQDNLEDDKVVSTFHSKSRNPKPDQNVPLSKKGDRECPHKEIVALYHEMLPELPRVKVWNETRKKLLRARWREDPERQNLDWWRGFFEIVRNSPFLLGQVMTRDGHVFQADLEWLIRPKNFVKVLEGKYLKKEWEGKVSSVTMQNIQAAQEFLRMQKEKENEES